jgi:hypothetical protein
MMPKYNIEYAVPFKRSAEVYHYRSDDPVACEEFLEELLERGYRIQAIRHEGLDLPKPPRACWLPKPFARRSASRRKKNIIGLVSPRETGAV